MGSESRPVRSTTSISSWNGAAVALLLPRDKLDPTSWGVAPARSLGSMLSSSSSLQVDDGGVSTPHLIESTFHTGVEVECVELIEVVDCRDVSRLRNLAASSIKGYSCLMHASVSVCGLGRLDMRSRVSGSLLGLDRLNPFLSSTQ